jgi:hypothetical protein
MFWGASVANIKTTTPSPVATQIFDNNVLVWSSEHFTTHTSGPILRGFDLVYTHYPVWCCKCLFQVFKLYIFVANLHSSYTIISASQQKKAKRKREIWVLLQNPSVDGLTILIAWSHHVQAVRSNYTSIAYCQLFLEYQKVLTSSF